MAGLAERKQLRGLPRLLNLTALDILKPAGINERNGRIRAA